MVWDESSSWLTASQEKSSGDSFNDFTRRKTTFTSSPHLFIYLVIHLFICLFIHLFIDRIVFVFWRDLEQHKDRRQTFIPDHFIYALSERRNVALVK